MLLIQNPATMHRVAITRTIAALPEPSVCRAAQPDRGWTGRDHDGYGYRNDRNHLQPMIAVTTTMT